MVSPLKISCTDLLGLCVLLYKNKCYLILVSLRLPHCNLSVLTLLQTLRRQSHRMLLHQTPTPFPLYFVKFQWCLLKKSMLFGIYPCSFCEEKHLKTVLRVVSNATVNVLH
jgi:hypothetical protein